MTAANLNTIATHWGHELRALPYWKAARVLDKLAPDFRAAVLRHLAD